MTTPELLGQLARGLRVTRQELNALDDLAEQLQDAAARVIAKPGNAQHLDELRDRCDRLLCWQVADARTTNAYMRTRVLSDYRELEQVAA